MTKNKVMMSVTRQYLDQLVIQSPSDIDNIEEELLKVTKTAIMEHNQAADKGDIWAVPQQLHTIQIAEVISAVFPVRRIACCPQNTDSDYDLLGIYMNEGEHEGIYVTSDDVFRKLIRKFDYTAESKKISEVMSALRDMVPRVTRNEDPDLIAVNNGIFNYRSKKLMSFSSDLVFLTKSSVDYNPNAKNPTIHNDEDNTDWNVEDWMKSLSDDEEIVELLWEIIGAIIRPNVQWNKSAWLYSETGNNGKGTLCELMRSICGDTSYASIPLSEFGKDFVLEPLTRASAIIVDENDVGSFIDKAGNLKSIITNDVIQINRKFKTPIAYQFRGFMVQCLNEYPRIRDKSDSFYRRQLFIPMTKCFTGQERKYIKWDYLHRKEVLEYILYRVCNMNYYSLSEPAGCSKALIEYKEYNDPVRQFFDEIRSDVVWDLLPFVFLYDLYKQWFKLNSPSGTIQGRNTFINDLLNVIKFDPEWSCPDKQHYYRVTDKNMSKTETLIAAYNLENWMDKKYKGPDIAKLCNPVLATGYRGIVRNTQATNQSVTMTAAIPQDDTDSDIITS